MNKLVPDWGIVREDVSFGDNRNKYLGNERIITISLEKATYKTCLKDLVSFSLRILITSSCGLPSKDFKTSGILNLFIF